MTTSPEITDKSAKSWAERWLAAARKTFMTVPAGFKLVWQAHRSATIGMAVLTLVSAFLPVLQAWAGKLIVDTVVEALNNKQPVFNGLQTALPFLLLEFSLIAISAIINQMRSLLEHLLNARLGHTVNILIINKALTLDLQHFERAEFYDKLQNARSEVHWRPLTVVNSSFLLVQNVITLLSIVTVLLAFSPLLAIGLFLITVPSFVVQIRYSQLHFRLLTWNAPEFRRRRYLEHLLTTDANVKEVKLFGLGEPLLQRYDSEFWRYYHEDAKLARRRSIVSLLWGILSTAGYYAAYAWIIWRTLEGNITLGDMTLYIALFRQSQGIFEGMFYNLGELYESSLFMSSLLSFLKLEPELTVAAKPQNVPDRINRGIEFRNVSFRYPGQQEWTLRNLNLQIAPGERIALVGVNGAGKTTLVKLLTRLYDPTEGQILLDGVDLRDYDPTELHQRIGVIFQDFVKYQATLRENIGYGQIDAMQDEARIMAAAVSGGADAVASELPARYDTMLGSWFGEGHELSGGQWQKIALGRAFMRDSEVLVLDEPTAALDAEREYEIFQRFRELTKGKIALLISHRFSTVRMADRIAVLDSGHLTELGSHDELMAQGGTYARLFSMQAEGYR